MSEDIRQDKIALSKKIQELREGAGFSQRGMARELLMDSKQYATIEHGESDLRSSTLIRIARFHQIEVGELFEYVANSN